MNRIHIAASLAGALLLAAFAPTTHAAPVTQWRYEVSLEWVDARFTEGVGRPLVSDTLISWGASEGDHLDPTGHPARSRSALGIDDTPARGTVRTNGAPAPTNTVTHYNNAILPGFAALAEAQLATTITLTPLAPAPGTPLDPFGTGFAVRFVETINRAPCLVPSTTVCDDIFAISLGTLDFDFDHAGTRYTLNILETTANLFGLSDEACALAGTLPGCTGLLTPERTFTPVAFAFTLHAALLPEPRLPALLALALLALAAHRRLAGRPRA